MAEYRLPRLEMKPGVGETIGYEKGYKIIDDDIVKNKFLMDLDDVHDDKYTKWAYRSTADHEFFNTSLGGHIALGYPYAFTRLADIPRRGLLSGRKKIEDDFGGFDLGYGRYHAEAFSSNAHPRILHMEFGVPKFRSMFSFYTTAVNFRASIIANEGRQPTAYNFGKAAGTAIGLILFPFRAGLLYLSSFVIKTVFGSPDTNYYTMKPTMHKYLQSAQNILTILLAERGLISIAPKDTGEGKYGAPATIDTAGLAELKNANPAIFNSVGSLDIMKIVARPQLMVNQYLKDVQNMIESGNAHVPAVSPSSPKDLQEASKAVLTETGDLYTYVEDENGNKVKQNMMPPPAPVTSTKVDINNVDGNDLATIQEADKDSYFSQIGAYMGVVSNYGFEYIGFYVDYVGSSTTTFSNSTKEIPAKSAMNSMSSNFRDMRFNLSGGNILGDSITSATRSIRDVVVGGLDGFTGGLSNVLLALAGGGFMKFPLMWDNSSITLPTHTLKIKLGGPYGCPISRAMDIDVPLSLLMAAVLPQSIGDQAYTSPFLNRSFLRGVLDIRLGMVTEFSVVAGEDDVGRDKNGAPLSVTVTLKITDFSDIPVATTNTGKLGAYEATLDENNPLTNYLRTLGGRSYMDSRFMFKNLKFRATVLQDGIKKAITPASMAAYVSGTVVGDVLEALNTDRAAAKVWENS